MRPLTVSSNLLLTISVTLSFNSSPRRLSINGFNSVFNVYPDNLVSISLVLVYAVSAALAPLIASDFAVPIAVVKSTFAALIALFISVVLV